MATIEPKGLLGIRLNDLYNSARASMANTLLNSLNGISSLSSDQYNAFVKKNEASIKASGNNSRYIDRLYRNKLFIDAFGLDEFKSYTPEQRDEKYRNFTIQNALKLKFGEDDEYALINDMLDTDAQYKLLKNDKYMGSTKRKEKLLEDIEESKRRIASYETSFDSPLAAFRLPSTQGAMRIGETLEVARPQDQFKSNLSKDSDILESLQAETQKRREDNVQALTNIIRENFLEADKRGEKALVEFENEFDKIATKFSNYYKAFKNTKSLEDYSHSDKLKDLAKTYALARQYGDQVALEYLDHTIQNRIAEDQDWRPTGNTLRKVGTSAWSNIGSTIAFFHHIDDMLDPERIAIWNMGKNPDEIDKTKPIKNERGEVIGYDYKDNDNIWSNPAYWQDLYTYNEFDSAGIQAAKEANGISKHINVRRYGETPAFFSWDTFEEGFGQLGNVLPTVALTYLTMGLSTGIGLGVRGAMRGLKMSANTIRAASAFGTFANDVAVLTVSAIPGAQMESMGQFNENIQKGDEDIERQITHEMREYANTIDTTSPEALREIQFRFDELKNRRISTEGEKTLSTLSDGDLMEIAKQEYEQSLMEAKYNELKAMHRKDEMAKAKAAGAAYITNFAMDFLKEAPLNATVEKFMIAKGALRGSYDNMLSKTKNIIKDTETGGVKAAEKRATFKGVLKSAGKLAGGGFADEYLDGLHGSFAEGIFSNEFNNYINKTYNPEIYHEAVDNVLGSLLAGANTEMSNLLERGNLYEGFIGMVSPVAMVGVNVGQMVFNAKDTWRAIWKGTDASGNKLDLAERASALLMNPLLNEYANLKAQDRHDEAVVEAVNSVVSEREKEVDKLADVLSTLNDHSTKMSPVKEVTDKEGDKIAMAPSILYAEDQKLWNAFTILNTLNELERTEGGTESGLYQETMDKIKRAAEGNLSEEESEELINKFLSDGSNKSVLEEENKHEIAAERIQKNSQYLLDMKQKMDDIQDKMDKSPAMKHVDSRVKKLLLYNLVAKDEFKSRLSLLEDELASIDGIGAVGSTRADGAYVPDFKVWYGTTSAKETAIAARKAEISKAKQKKEEVSKNIEETKEKVKEAEKNYRKAATEQDRMLAYISLQKQQTLLKAQQLQHAALQHTEDTLDEEIDNIQSLINNEAGDFEFTEEGIMQLDARDRAEVLYEGNEKNYSSAQKKVIRKVRNKLAKDPEAMQKVMDASTLANRISDLDELYKKLLDNDELTAAYLSAEEKRRMMTAMAISLEQGKQEHFSKIEKAYTELKEAEGSGSSSESESPASSSKGKRKRRGKGKKGQRQTKKNNPQPPLPSIKDALKNTILSVGDSRILDAYIEEHPEQAADLEPYISLAKFMEDVVGALVRGSKSNREVIAKRNWLENVLAKANPNNEKEAMDCLEDILEDNTYSDVIKDWIDTLLDDLVTTDRQRRTTAVENRKARKERLEKEAKARKEREESARKAAEEAAKEMGEENGIVEFPVSASLGKGINVSGKYVVEKDGDWFTAAFQGERMAMVSISTEEANALGINIREFLNKYNFTPEEYRNYLTEFDEGCSIYSLNVHTDGSCAILFSLANGTKGLSLEGEGAKKIVEKFFPRLMSVVKKESEEEEAEGEEEEEEKGPAPINPEALSEDEEDILEKEEEEEDNLILDNIDDAYIVNNGDGTIEGKPASLEHQVAELEDENSGNIYQGNADYQQENGRIEDVMNNSASTVSANGMSEWESDSLEEGVLVRKTGNPGNWRKKPDSMYLYRRWMEAAGINLQSIIDNEVPLILERNPATKIKFMRVRPSKNATHDDHMEFRMMLVVDYNDSINKQISSIHREENGGVITSNGKKYLIVGVAGYPQKGETAKAKETLYLSMFGLKTNPLGSVIQDSNRFFSTNPSERFYVSDNLSTEVVPGSMIPGYLINTNVDETVWEHKDLVDLLVDDLEINPHGFKSLSQLKFGIQMGKKFWAPVSEDQILVPQNLEENLGRAFVLIPAANGKYVPAYLKTIFYSDIKDKNSELMNRVDRIFEELTYVNNTAADRGYSVRVGAIAKLMRMFYFDRDKKGEVILIGKNGEITFRKKGMKEMSFNVNRSSRDDIKAAFAKMDVRLNFTPSVLSDPTELQLFHEAGALKTDLAILGTVGSSYSIFGLKRNGEMMDAPETVFISPASTSNKFRGDNFIQVPYGKGGSNYYKYYRKSGEYYKEGEVDPVSDDDLIQQLDWNRIIIERKLLSVKEQGDYKYYVLSHGANPEVIRVNDSEKYKVEKLSTQEAIDFLQELEEDQKRKEREANASEDAGETIVTTVVEDWEDEDVENEDGEGSAGINMDGIIEEEEFSITDQEESNESPSTEETNPIIAQVITTEEEIQNSSLAALMHGSSDNPTISFEELYRKGVHMKRINKIVGKKHPKAISSVSALKKFLSDIDVPTEGITQTREGIEAWYHTLKCKLG